MNGLPRCIAVIALLLASGCDPATTVDLADYRTRVQRAAGSALLAPALPQRPLYPSHRQRAVAIPDVRGSVWELLFDLPDCELGHLVSERNSILGRYWPATSRFDYELRFRLRLDRCRARLSGRPPADDAERGFHARLDEIHEAKRGTLAAVWWALTYDSAEFEQAFSPASDLLTPGDTGAAAHNALEYLLAVSSQLRSPADGVALAPLERTLQQLAASRYGGGLLRSIAALTAELDASSTALEQSQPCPQQRPTPQARVLHAVFNRHYVERIQPYMATIQRGGAQWLDLHDRLLASQQVRWPPAFERFRADALDREGKLWQQWLGSRDRHVRAWQQLLSGCGLSPGRAAH